MTPNWLYHKAACTVCFEFKMSPLQDPDVRDGSKDKRKRENHTVLERMRRSEQRNLFDKLQTVLRSDPRAPRLHLLSEVISTCCSFSFSLLESGGILQENYSDSVIVFNHKRFSIHFVILKKYVYQNYKIMFSLSALNIQMKILVTKRRYQRAINVIQIIPQRTDYLLYIRYWQYKRESN